MKELKCVDYGFTMIDNAGNVLPNLSDYNKHCSMIIIGDIRRMLNIPPEYVTGDDCNIPNLTDFVNDIIADKEHFHFFNYRGKVYVAIPDNEFINPYFMDITNQADTLKYCIEFVLSSY